MGMFPTRVAPGFNFPFRLARDRPVARDSASSAATPILVPVLGVSRARPPARVSRTDPLYVVGPHRLVEQLGERAGGAIVDRVRIEVEVGLRARLAQPAREHVEEAKRSLEVGVLDQSGQRIETEPDITAFGVPLR